MLKFVCFVNFVLLLGVATGADDKSFVEITAEFGELIDQSRHLERFSDIVSLLSFDEVAGDLDKVDVDPQEVDGEEMLLGDPAGNDRKREGVGKIQAVENTIEPDDSEAEDSGAWEDMHDDPPPPDPKEGKMPWKLPAALHGPLNQSTAGRIYGLPGLDTIPMSLVWRDKYAQNLNITDVPKGNLTEVVEDLSLRAKSSPNDDMIQSPSTSQQRIRIEMPKRRRKQSQRHTYDVKDVQAAADSLTSFLQTSTSEGEPDDIWGFVGTNKWRNGLLADYFFEDGEMESQGGVKEAPTIEDIGGKCGKPAKLINADGASAARLGLKRALYFQKGTGFNVPNIKELGIGEGSDSSYTILMRIRFDETAGPNYHRILNLNHGSDHGCYAKDTIVCAPGSPGFHKFSAEEWHDLAIQYDKGSARIIIDGQADKIWKVDPRNMGMQVHSDSLVFFNDQGPDCTSSEENTAGQVSRIMIFSRQLSELELSDDGTNPMNKPAMMIKPGVKHDGYEAYTGNNACVCPGGDTEDLEEGHLKCKCHSYCDCQGPPAIPPPPEIKWNLASDCGWVWRFRPHHAWAWWTYNRWMALAGSEAFRMSDFIKFNGLHSAFGRGGRIKVWRAELFTFHVRKGREQRISGYKVLRNWNPWQTSWNNRPHSEPSPLFTTDVRYLRHNQWAVSSSPQLAKACEDWINGGKNYGMLLRVSSEPGRHWHHFGILAALHHPLKPRLRLWMSKWG